MPKLSEAQARQIEQDLAELNPEQQRQYMDALESTLGAGGTAPMARAGMIGPPPTAGDALQNLRQSPVGRFAAGAWESANPVTLLRGLGNVVAHPVDTFQVATQAMGDQWFKAGTDLNQGNYVEAVGHGLAGTIPLIGPAAAHAGERVGEGDIAGGLGEGAGMLIPLKAPKAVTAAVRGVPVGGRQLGVLPAVNKASAPFAAFVDSELAQAAQRQGVELPAGARSRSGFVPAVEAWAAKGPGGDAARVRITNAAHHLSARADHVVARASRLGTEAERGAVIAKGFKNFRDAWIREKNGLYSALERSMPNFTLKAPETVRLLRQIVEEKRAAKSVGQGGPAADASFYQGLLDGLTETVERPGPTNLPGRTLMGADAPVNVPAKSNVPRAVRVDAVRSFLRELNAKIGGAHADAWSAANKQLLKKLAATLDGEFESSLKNASPEIAAKLERANAAYKAGHAKLTSAFGERINKYARTGNYSEISRAIANSRMSLEDIPRIFEVAGPEGADAIRATVLADIVHTAKNPASGNLTPQGLARAMDKYGDRLPALLKPEQLKTLQDLSRLSASMERVGKVAEGSQTAYLTRIGGHMAATAAAPLVGLKLLLLDAGFNKFIGSKYGQRWLTEGFPALRIPSLDTTANRVSSAATAAAGRTPATQTAPATR